MGLKRGEEIKRLFMIEVISVTAQPLKALTDDLEYGKSEMIREGFPEMNPEDFVQMLCKANKKTPNDLCNRIEFKRV